MPWKSVGKGLILKMKNIEGNPLFVEWLWMGNTHYSTQLQLQYPPNPQVNHESSKWSKSLSWKKHSIDKHETWNVYISKFEWAFRKPPPPS